MTATTLILALYVYNESIPTKKALVTSTFSNWQINSWIFEKYERTILSEKKKKNDEFVNFETPHALGDWARPSQKKAMMTQSLYQGNESKEKRKRGGGVDGHT